MFESVPFLRRLFTKPHRNPFEEKEAEVRAQLAPHFNEYEFLFAKVNNCVLHTVTAYSAHPEVQRAAGKLEWLLLMRLLADLRVCQLAASGGYPLQALALASSAHEVAFSVIYIGDSDDRSIAWAQHSNERKQYPEAGHRAVVEYARTALGLSDSEVEREHRVYMRLCWGKHGNPKLQRYYGANDVGASVEVQQQPYFSELTIRFGRYAIYHSCRVVACATRVFIGLHLRDVEHANLISALDIAEAQMKQLAHRDKVHDT